MATVKLYKFDTADSAWKPHDQTADDVVFKSVDVNAVTDLIGGVQKQNLIDKTATETISGSWTYNTDLPQSSIAPTVGDDFANKTYVDLVASGLSDFKDSVKAVTVAALPAHSTAGDKITATGNGAFATVDGITINSDGTAGSDDGTEAGSEEILVNNDGSATAAYRGIYFLSDPGSAGFPWVLTRRSDADTSPEVTAGMYLFVEEGSTKADTSWILATDDAITLNTTALSFVQFSSLSDLLGGAGIVKSVNTLAVDLDGSIPGLEFDVGGDAGKLRVLPNPAGGLEVVAAGVGVNLETVTPTIDIVANELGVKFDATLGALAAGLSVVGLPSLFEINEIAVGGTVTAANLDNLTNGKSAPETLHRHGVIEGIVCSGGWTATDPLRFSANDTAIIVGIDTALQARVVGLADATQVNLDAGTEINTHSRLIGPFVSLASKTAGDPVYWSGSAWDTTLPAAGKFTSLGGYVSESDGTDGSFVWIGAQPVFVVP